MKKVIKISTKICGALLAVLGFSVLAASCKYGMPVKYGMLPEEFISGKVTDKVTGEPILGIQVKQWGNDYTTTSFTNENGNYHIRTYEIQSNLTFSDVDGEENGLYNDTTISITTNVNNIALTPKN